MIAAFLSNPIVGYASIPNTEGHRIIQYITFEDLNLPDPKFGVLSSGDCVLNKTPNPVAPQTLFCTILLKQADLISLKKAAKNNDINSITLTFGKFGDLKSLKMSDINIHIGTSSSKLPTSNAAYKLQHAHIIVSGIVKDDINKIKRESISNFNGN